MHAQTFGVEAVFGRSVLHEYEIVGMKVTNNIVSLFDARKKSGDWVAWEQRYPEEAEILAWAANQFKAFEAEWQNESK